MSCSDVVGRLAALDGTPYSALTVAAEQILGDRTERQKNLYITALPTYLLEISKRSKL